MQKSNPTNQNVIKDDKRLCELERRTEGQTWLREKCPRCGSETDSYKSYTMIGKGGTTVRVFLFKCSQCGKAWRRGKLLERVDITKRTGNPKAKPLTKSRKATSLAKQISLEQFDKMQKTMDPKEIAILLCQHYEKDEDRARCPACRKAIVRLRHKIENQKRKSQSYAPMDDFDKIPEIQKLMEFLKPLKDRTRKTIRNQILRMWAWIRESGRNELIRTQRPALWGDGHIIFILAKLAGLKISTYGYKQALRRLFESLGRHELLKDRRLRGSQKDLRSPNNAKKRPMDRFTPSQVPKIMSICNTDEQFATKLHITLKCRIAAFFALDWSNVRWKDEFYGLPMMTMDVYESKGNVLWKHCPVDLWFGSLSKDLRERWEKSRCPTSGKIIPFDYGDYRKLWIRISKNMGFKLEPYDCRRSPSGWLRDLGLSDLAIGQYDASTGEGTGFTGSGWQNPQIYFTRYGKMNPLAIYDRSQRLDVSMFDGSIHKILNNRTL